MSSRVPSALASTPMTFAFFSCLLPVANCDASSKVCNIAAAVASLQPGAQARSEPLCRRLRSYRAECPPRTERGAPRPAPKPMLMRHDPRRAALLPSNVSLDQKCWFFPRSLFSPQVFSPFVSSSFAATPRGARRRVAPTSLKVEKLSPGRSESLPQPQPQRCTRGEPTEAPLCQSVPRQGSS